MNPETFVDPHLPLADLVVLDNLLRDVENRTGSRDVSRQKGHDGSNGIAAFVTSTDTTNGSTAKSQNGNVNGNSSEFRYCLCHLQSLLTSKSKTPKISQSPK
jgi:hypothetical protein